MPDLRRLYHLRRHVGQPGLLPEEAGAGRIHALLSHNIISKQGVELVNQSPIDQVISTDTISNPNILGQPKFRMVSRGPHVRRDGDPLL